MSFFHVSMSFDNLFGHVPMLVWFAAFCKNYAVLQKNRQLNIDRRVLQGLQYFYSRAVISYFNLLAMKKEQGLLETM